MAKTPKKKKAIDALMSRHRAFVRHYVVHRKPMEACVAAGYKPSAVRRTAYDILKRDDVKAAIAEIEAEVQERTEVKLDEIVNELARIAFTGLGRFVSVGPDGDPFIDFSKVSQEDIDLLSEIQVDDVVEGRSEDKRTIRKIKIKPMDRLNALVTLGKHLGLMNKSEEEQVSSLTQALRELAQRGSPQPFGARNKP